MCKKCAPFLLAIVIIGLVANPVNATDEGWQKPRPLGNGINTYRPPRPIESNDSVDAGINNPTGVITLRDALALALMQNPGLRTYAWKVRAAEAYALQSRYLPNPELEVELEEFGGTGGTSGLNGSAFSITLGQLIEFGGKRKKRKRIATLDQNLAGWDYESKRIEVLTEATKAFVDVLTVQERMALAEELVKLSELVYKTVAERVKAGKVSPIEEVKASVTLSSNQLQLVRVRSELQAAHKRLAATWGSESPKFSQVKGDFFDVSPIPPFSQLVKHISNNPDLARRVLEMKRRKVALELEKANRIPDLTASAGVSHFNETNDTAFLVGISIPIPIFDRNKGGILGARYRLSGVHEEHKSVELGIRTSLAEIYQTLFTAYAEVTTLKTNLLPATQKTFDAVTEGYRYGKFNYLDVLDAQRTLFEVKGQYVEALAIYHKSIADIEQLIGKPLSAIKGNSK